MLFLYGSVLKIERVAATEATVHAIVCTELMAAFPSWCTGTTTVVPEQFSVDVDPVPTVGAA